MRKSLTVIILLLFAAPAFANDWVAVVAYDGDNRVTKYQPFDSQSAADAHVAAFLSKYPDIFATTNPGGNVADWLVDPAAHTVSISARPLTNFFLAYEKFQNRFTADELDALGEFIYETDTDTGRLKRVRLMQAYNRAVASNSIDLLAEKTATFMATLVEGKVLTQARSDQILDPSQSSP